MLQQHRQSVQRVILGTFKFTWRTLFLNLLSTDVLDVLSTWYTVPEQVQNVT